MSTPAPRYRAHYRLTSGDQASPFHARESARSFLRSGHQQGALIPIGVWDRATSTWVHDGHDDGQDSSIMIVRIYHHHMLSSSAALTLVYAYTVNHTIHNTALAEAYRLCTVGHDPEFGPVDARASHYRERGNRSLSVGDVVAMTTDPTADEDQAVFYAVAPAGFAKLDTAPTIDDHASPGTTPIAS